MGTEFASEIAATLARIRTRADERKRAFSILPCAPCVEGSPSATACAFAKSEDCKHVQRGRDQRKAYAVRDARAARLSAAGVAIDDHRIASVLDGRGSQTRAVMPTNAALANPRLRWLLLWGPPGRGKTVAALSVLANRERGLFVRAHELSLPRPIERADVRRADAWTLDQAMTARTLVIDDLGVERESEYAQTQIDSVITGRDFGPVLTLCTSNLAPKALVERYGGRFESRVCGEFGRVIHCEGPDLRARVSSSSPAKEKP